MSAFASTLAHDRARVRSAASVVARNYRFRVKAVGIWAKDSDFRVSNDASLLAAVERSTSLMSFADM